MHNPTRVGTSIARGLDAIFSASNTPAKTAEKNEILSLPLTRIVPSPFQARHTFSSDAIAELAESIKIHGILQPLLVRPLQDQRYELLAGERRLRAAQSLHLSHVPVIVFSVDDMTAMAFGLVENIQRQNLNVIDEANAYARLLNEFQLSHDALSEKVGKSRSHITNIMRLNQLPDEVKQYVVDEKLTMGHARAILSLPDDRQIEMAEWIIQRGMSVRQTEDFMKTVFEKTVHADPHNPFFIPSDELKQSIKDWQVSLTNQYKIPSKIYFDARGRGRIVMEAESVNEFKKLMDMLLERVI